MPLTSGQGTLYPVPFFFVRVCTYRHEPMNVGLCRCVYARGDGNRT
jgi:hypothetical protein